MSIRANRKWGDTQSLDKYDWLNNNDNRLEVCIYGGFSLDAICCIDIKNSYLMFAKLALVLM
ncbi:MAG: hypothetical protein V7K97_06810 [Nostoc sp.]|uniref:hypothetical protein n=1 Tax=Nostoc sp. TaxID=1180 RepID=UPI002FFCCE37